VKEAAEEVRRVRLDRDEDDEDDDDDETNPRTVSALRADLADAEALVALSNDEKGRIAALDRCVQLRLAIETAQAGATWEARRRRVEEKDDEYDPLNTSMETEPGTGETWINS
jgi:hypothetical protein